MRALALYLLAAHHLPLARTAQLLSDVVALPVSEGSLAAWYTGAAENLEPFCDAVKAQLAQAPCSARTRPAPGWTARSRGCTRCAPRR